MSDIRFNQWLHNSGTGGVSQVDGGHVGIGTTNPEIAVHSGNNKILNVGIVTASTYYGDGSNLSGIVGGGTSLSFNDNIGAYFGNSQDLKIYHDGNHSYIDDQGTGNLRLRSGTLEISNLAGNKTSATFSSGGGQTLNFNNSARFVTTNTGAVVTGIFTATSSLNVKQSGNAFLNLLSTGTGNAGIYMDASNGDISGSDYCFIGQDNNLDLVIQANANAGHIDFKRASNTNVRITSTGRLNVGDSDIGQNVDQLSVTVAAQNALDNIARFQSTAAPSGTSESLVKVYKGAGYGGVVSGYITQGVDHGLKLYTANNGALTEQFRINASGVITQPNQPVFSGAYVGSQSANFGTSEFTMIFNTVMTNQGNHYNTSTGEYTCPVNGKYWVSAQAHLQTQTGGAYTTIRLQKNTVTQSNAWKSDGSGGTLFAHCVMSCGAGDTLRVRIQTNDSTQYTAERYWVASIYLVA